MVYRNRSSELLWHQCHNNHHLYHRSMITTTVWSSVTKTSIWKSYRLLRYYVRPCTMVYMVVRWWDKSIGIRLGSGLISMKRLDIHIPFCCKKLPYGMYCPIYELLMMQIESNLKVDASSNENPYPAFPSWYRYIVNPYCLVLSLEKNWALSTNRWYMKRLICTLFEGYAQFKSITLNTNITWKWITSCYYTLCHKWI